LTRSWQKYTLLNVPSYFGFAVLHNLLLKREADFVSTTEYVRVSEGGCHLFHADELPLLDHEIRCSSIGREFWHIYHNVERLIDHLARAVGALMDQ
jgi:hypothetical protein